MQCRILQSVGISFLRLQGRYMLMKLRLDSMCPRTRGHIRRSGLSFLSGLSAQLQILHSPSEVLQTAPDHGTKSDNAFWLT